MQRKWITFFGLVFSTVLFVLISQAKPALSITPPMPTVNKMAAEMGNLIGRKLTRPILLADAKTAPSSMAGIVRQTNGRNGAFTIAVKKVKGTWQAQDFGEKMDTCLIVWLSDYSRDPQEDSLLAHEIYHCFQNELTGVRALPEWFGEGSAMWAGEEYMGGTRLSRRMWRDYLNNRTPIFSRVYDAIGLFAHLKNSGVNVWQALDQIYKEAPKTSDALFEELVKISGDTFLTNWASGLARIPGAGSDWNTTGAGITKDQRAPIAIALSPSTPIAQEVLRGVQELYDVQIPNGKIVEFNIDGYGALRWTGSKSDVKFKQALKKRYCVGETCRCQDGSTPTGVEVAPSNRVLLGVTGTTRSALVAVTAQNNQCTIK